MSNSHKVVFRWPYNAEEVFVTGTFDSWARSELLKRDQTGFATTVYVPWGEKVLYKFVVDGRWCTTDQAPTETDWRGNVNNVYYAPPKPRDDTPNYDPPAAKEPKVTPVPAPGPVEDKKGVTTPVPQPTEEGSVEVPAKPKQEPVKDETPIIDKKGPSPPVDGKVTPSVPGIPPVSVVPVNNIKPVNTPPSKTEGLGTPEKAPTTVQPAPSNQKAPLFIVPVNDANTVDKQPPVVEPPKHNEIPSTHALPVNIPRKSSTGTSSSNTLLTEKKEEEKKDAKPEVPKQHNGTVGGEPAKQPPSTPVKATTPAHPTTPAVPEMLPSPPTTPKKSHFFGSTSSSPPSSPGDSISRKGSHKKKKRDSFISKVKHLFTPEKDKEQHKERSHG